MTSSTISSIPLFSPGKKQAMHVSWGKRGEKKGNGAMR